MRQSRKDHSSRDWGSQQPRGNSRGQSRGNQSRGQDIRRSQPNAPQQFNTIQHSKTNVVATKPTAKVGNFVSNGNHSSMNQGRSSINSGQRTNHQMNNSLGFQHQPAGLSMRQQNSNPPKQIHQETQKVPANINSNKDCIQGLNQKQTMIYNELFNHFSGDGNRISAIEFFKLCKVCKIYPVVITFEDLKKIVLKNKEFWQQNQGRSGSNERQDIPEPSQDNSFPFLEFVNAFRIIGRIGYQNTQESDMKKFQMVTQYLQKQLKLLKQKNAFPHQKQSVTNSKVVSNVQSETTLITQNQMGSIASATRYDRADENQQTPQVNQFQTMNYNSDVRPKKEPSLTTKKYSEDQTMPNDFQTVSGGPQPDGQYRQPNFFNKQMGSIGYDDDNKSIKTAGGEPIYRGQTINAEVRSEYSGIRGGGRTKNGYGGPVTLQHNQNLQTLGGGVQPMMRANTIHRALMGPNQQILKPKGKKMKSGTRKNHHGPGTMSMKTDVRGVYNHQDMRQVYASTTSNQPQRSLAVNSRGVSNISNVSGVASSINSKQFQQVRLRQDLSVKSNKSPNRYSVVSGVPNRVNQQTINYTGAPIQSSLVPVGDGQNVKQISQSLVAQHRNKNLVGQSLNRPYIKPVDTMSVGLNKNFNKNRDTSEQKIRNSQLGSVDRNPLDEDDRSDNNKLLTDQQIARRDRDLSNSQRSFRIRKYVRSISRGSNHSNLTQDHANRQTDPNQKTIEQPTDVEDAHDDYEQSEFGVINQTPDIRLKSIEVDCETTIKKRNDVNYEIDDDESGTGHKKQKSSSLVQSNSYGSTTDTHLKNQRDKAFALINNIQNRFHQFKKDYEGNTHQPKLNRNPSQDSYVSGYSQSSSSKRFVKIKKSTLKTIQDASGDREYSSTRSAVNSSEDKDATIARLWTQNNIKNQRIKELEAKLQEMMDAQQQ